jgi:2-polyprenyl-3-methyl-5-hydroxy-6-metoxy-1,4-benzoquinol methylase
MFDCRRCSKGCWEGWNLFRCGFGVLVPSLTKAGVDQKQIYGVDLSPEMIRNAQEFLTQGSPLNQRTFSRTSLVRKSTALMQSSCDLPFMTCLIMLVH